MRRRSRRLGPSTRIENETLEVVLPEATGIVSQKGQDPPERRAFRDCRLLRRGTVVSVDRPGEVTVEVGGERRRALAFEAMTGPIAAGDEVVVNGAALDLGPGAEASTWCT